MMKVLFIVNDPPYGTERVYNALRLAHALLKKEPQTAVTVFLMADSVVAAKAGQKTPDGYYNIERMLKRVLAGTGKVLLCGTCMDARGLDDASLMAGAQRSTMDELAATTIEADKVIVF
ncbi:MAG: DsrE family protein [Pseudolabrys sp.]|nr:DsrE family protein [Pseudolabrys sp.]MDP2294577.1 DsrE family protein [Pseudolabrys sp.]